MDAGIPHLDFRRLRSHPRGRSRIRRNITDSSLPRPDLGQLRSGLRRRLHIRVEIITNSGLPGFDLCPLHPLPRGQPSAFAALPGGNSFPCLDLGTFPWGRLMGRRLFPWGLRRWRICRDLLRGRFCGSVRFPVRLLALGRLFLLQKRLHPAPRLIGPTGGGVLDPVAAVVAGLPPLGCLPELAPQAFCPVIQPTADKLLRRGLDFFL